MRVAILGAYGAVGARLAQAAAEAGHRVTAAGRDPYRLEQVPADTHRRLDVTDPSLVRVLAAGHDAVVNATGLQDVQLASASTAGGAAYLDLSAEGAYLEQLRALTSPQQPIAAGIGLAPGLTNLMAAGVPGTGPIHIGVVGGVGERHGDAAREWVWGAAGRVVHSGGGTERVYRTSRRFDIPGLGHRTLLRADFAEQDQLSRDLVRPVSSWLGLDPAWATSTLRCAGHAPRLAPILDRLSGPLTRLAPGRDGWAVVVTDAERTIRWARGRRETEATALVTTLCLKHLRRAAPGVYPAHHLVSLDALIDPLRQSGIEVGSAS